MTEKRFIEPYEDCRVIKNIQTGETATYYDTEDGLMFLKWLNNLSEENEQLKEENQQLNKILKIIADAESFRVENSVKEILRNNLFGLDTVAGESFNAYKDYTLLNNFFKEHYGEHWDNDKYD